MQPKEKEKAVTNWLAGLENGIGFFQLEPHGNTSNMAGFLEREKAQRLTNLCVEPKLVGMQKERHDIKIVKGMIAKEFFETSE